MPCKKYLHSRQTEIKDTGAWIKLGSHDMILHLDLMLTYYFEGIYSVICQEQKTVPSACFG